MKYTACFVEPGLNQVYRRFYGVFDTVEAAHEFIDSQPLGWEGDYWTVIEIRNV